MPITLAVCLRSGGRPRRLVVLGTTKEKICRNCGKAQASRPRGLCGRCFGSAARKRFEPRGRAGEYGTLRPDQRSGLGRLPGRPTTALPGTPEKERVVRERAARGEAIYHPLDASRCLS